MPKAKLDGEYSSIELTINSSFIRKYELEHIQIPDIVPEITYYLDNDEFTFPFLFPEGDKRHSEEYVDLFIKEINKILTIESSDKEVHLNHLLFLTYTLPDNSNRNKQEQAYRNYYKYEGKLLLELLKAPFPAINKDNVYEFVNEQELLGYLYVVSKGKDPKLYIAKDGSISLSKVSQPLWKKLNDKINEDINIKVPLTTTKNLIISKDIIIQFHDNKIKKSFKPVAPEYDLHNTLLMQSVVKDIVERQKTFNSQFYKALLTYDYLKGNHRYLSKIVAVSTKTAYWANLYELYKMIEKYLIDEKIFNGQLAKRRINTFIYQFFSLLGLLIDDRKPKPNNSVEDLLVQQHGLGID